MIIKLEKTCMACKKHRLKDVFNYWKMGRDCIDSSECHVENHHYGETNHGGGSGKVG